MHTCTRCPMNAMHNMQHMCGPRSDIYRVWTVVIDFLSVENNNLA